MTSKGLLETIEIPRIPSCLNCLAWSEDQELAVATGDEVFILTPRNPKSPESATQDTSNPNTRHVSKFQVSLFTSAEWPLVNPDSFPYYSIGEEQSTSTVTALSWSPTGLARHQRSLLAVLTSNLVLSLWTDNETGRWERVLVVNNALRGFLEPVGEDLDLVRHRISIRSAVWCPRYDEVDTIDHKQDRRRSRPKEYLMAVGNNEGEVLILGIQRVRASSKQSTVYTARVLSQHAIASDTAIDSEEPESLFSSSLDYEKCASYLAWGPWLEDGASEKLQSMLAVVFQGKLSLFFVQRWLSKEKDTQNYATALSNINHGLNLPNVCGNVAWHHDDRQGTIALAVGGNADSVTLLLSSECYSKALATSINDGFTVASNGHPDLSNFPESEKVMLSWSSLGVSSTDHPTVTSSSMNRCLIVSTHLSKLAAFDISATTGTSSTRSDLRLSHALQEVQRRYNFKYKLEDQTLLKTWGLASTDKNVATCVTCHPADMVEYLTSSLERSWVLIHRIEDKAESTEDETQANGLGSGNVEAVRKKIQQWIQRLPASNMSQTSTIDSKIRALATSFRSRVGVVSSDPAHLELDKSIEICEICGATITPEDSDVAFCEAGHQFSKLFAELNYS
ncbi:MAG: hypothetical protein Q9227_004760 [Pyrenula ochraceoflavens]